MSSTMDDMGWRQNSVYQLAEIHDEDLPNLDHFGTHVGHKQCRHGGGRALESWCRSTSHYPENTGLACGLRHEASSSGQTS